MNNKRYNTFRVKARNITLPVTYSWSSGTVARAKGLRSGGSVRNQEGIYITKNHANSERRSNMKYRKPTKPKTDKKIFHVTASKTKKINVSPKTMRGGIRL